MRLSPTQVPPPPTLLPGRHPLSFPSAARLGSPPAEAPFARERRRREGSERHLLCVRIASLFVSCPPPPGPVSGHETDYDLDIPSSSYELPRTTQEAILSAKNAATFTEGKTKEGSLISRAQNWSHITCDKADR